MKESLKKRIYQSLTESDVSSARVFLACSSVLWSGILAEPFDIFDSIKVPFLITTYVDMDTVWSILFAIYALMSFIILVTKCKTKWFKLSESILGFTIWTIACISIFYSYIHLPAIAAPMFVGTILSWWVLIRSGLDK